MYSVNEVSITWSGSDLGSGIHHYEVDLDNGQMTNVGSVTGWAFNNLGDGSHIINVIAVDNSGKMRMSFVIVVIDTIAPMLSISNPSEGGFYFLPDVNVTWTSMEFGSGLASYDVRVDGGAWQSRGTATYALLHIVEGVHTIYVRVTDVAGNSRTSGVNFTLGLNPAVIHSIYPADGTIVNTTMVVFDEMLAMPSV